MIGNQQAGVREPRRRHGAEERKERRENPTKAYWSAHIFLLLNDPIEGITRKVFDITH
jgi:hypothetical protein